MRGRSPIPMFAPVPAPARPTLRRRWKALAAAATIAAHAAVVAALLAMRPHPLSPPQPVALPVSLVVWRPPEPPPPPPEPPKASEPAGDAAPAAAQAPPKPAPPQPPTPIQVKTAPPPPEIKPVPAASAPPAPRWTVLGASQIAGAAQAGDGAGEGEGAGGQGRGVSCDMVGRLQAALRRDVRVRAAVSQAGRAAEAGEGALVVWNGDWVQSPGEDGKGLATVRQAIMLEVAFAPQPCRTRPMRGLVLLSMADGPGAARVVLGAGAWRWSDLLGVSGQLARR